MGKDIDEAASGFGNVFRDRLTYLMNGNNVYGKPVNTQELADEIDISRPAVRKYIKPNDRREVTVGGSPIALTAREFDVLALLMAHAGTVLTRERIAHEALGYEYVGDTNNVDVHIAHLRAKIEDAGGARIIQTVRGVGYVCRA